MSFEIEAGRLIPALSSAASVARDGRSIEILGCVMLSAVGGRLSIRATDMEIALTQHADGTGDLPAIVVPAARLQGVLAPLPKSAVVRLAPGDGVLSVTAGGIRARLSTLDVADFPSHGASEAAPVTMDAASLFRLLDRPSHAISTEETKWYLCGISLRAGDGLLIAEATDGNILHRATEPMPAEWAAPPVIIPRQTVALLTKLLAGAGGQVAVRLDDRRLEVKAEGWAMASKLIDGSFPDTDRVIPRGDGASRIHISDPTALSMRIKAATSVSDDKTRPARLLADGEVLRVTATDSKSGTVDADAPEDVARWEGAPPPGGIAFQARYLLALLDRSGGSVAIHATEATAPIRAECATGLAVLMPLRV